MSSLLALQYIYWKEMLSHFFLYLLSAGTKDCVETLSGFVFGSPEFNSLTVLCKYPAGQPSTTCVLNSLCSTCICGNCLFIFL